MTQQQPETQTAHQTGHRWIVMTAVFLATFMTSVEVTIVTTALPSIISELHGLAFQSWIMSAYLLTTAISTPIYGKLADRLGRKSVFLWGVVVFTLGSWLSGLAPGIHLLIAARALQGIGAGAVMPLTFTIIADLFEFKERARVMAFNNTAWGLSALIGPMLGGFLVDTLSWHWVFYVNIPFGVMVFVLVWFGYGPQNRNLRNARKEKIRERQAQRKLSLDVKGILLLAATLVCALVGVQYLETQLIVSIVLFVAAALCLALLVVTEHRAADPLISPAMFANRTFTIQMLTVSLVSGVLIAYQVYFPIWLQSLYRMQPTTSGMVVSASSIMWLISSFFVAMILRKFVPKYVVLVLLGIEMVFYIILSAAGLNFPVWMFYVTAGVNGAIIGIIVSMGTILVQHLAAPDTVGSATSVLTLGRTLGQTLLTGIYGATLNFTLNAHRGSIPFSTISASISSESGVAPTPEISAVILQGLHSVFFVVIALLAVAIVLNLLDPNKRIIK